MTTIAFLGLGHMGGPMAANLVKAGHRVLGFDLVPAALEAATAAGVEVVASGQDAAASADVVITMFPSGRHVLEAYRGADDEPGLLAVATGRALRRLLDDRRGRGAAAHALAAAAGKRSLDAPVSGGVVGAENATLAFMVGGADDDFAAARPLLEAMGRRIVHCGGAGLGQAAKVCNNMILGHLADRRRRGVRARRAARADPPGALRRGLQRVGPVLGAHHELPVPGPVPTSPANRDYAPGFAGALMSKDLGLAEQAIDLTGVDARLGRLAREIYPEFAAGEGAGQDFSGIINTIRNQSEERAA